MSYFVFRGVIRFVAPCRVCWLREACKLSPNNIFGAVYRVKAT